MMRIPPPGSPPPLYRVFRTLPPSRFVFELRKDPAERFQMAIGAETLPALMQLEARWRNSWRGVDFEDDLSQEQCLVQAVYDGSPFQRRFAYVHLLGVKHLPLEKDTGIDTGSLAFEMFRTVPGDVVLQFAFDPDPRPWRGGWRNPVDRVQKGLQWDPSASQALEEKLRHAPYRLRIRAAVQSADPGAAEALVRALEAWADQFRYVTGGPALAVSHFGPPEHSPASVAFFGDSMLRDSTDWPEHRSGYGSLSPEEIFSLFPLPFSGREADLPYASVPRLRAAAPLAPKGGGAKFPPLSIGRVLERPQSLSGDPGNTLVVGKTDSGKSTHTERLAGEHLALEPAARCIFVDPHGTSVGALLSALPLEVLDSTVLFDPRVNAFQGPEGEPRVSLGFNLLDLPRGTAGGREAIARGAGTTLGDVLKDLGNIFGEELVGTQVRRLFDRLGRSVFQLPGATLGDLGEVLTDPKALEALLERLPEGDEAGQRLLREVAPFQKGALGLKELQSTINKLSPFDSDPLVRRTFCQRSGAMRFEDLLERSRLLLLDLSKPELTDATARLMGTIFLTRFWAAVRRGAGGPDRPLYIVVDEFQNFNCPALREMLEEGAKYGVRLILVTQYLTAADPRLLDSILANVSTWFFFTLSEADARRAIGVARGRPLGVSPEDLQALPRHHALTVPRDGPPFILRTYPRPTPLRSAAEAHERVMARGRKSSLPDTSGIPLLRPPSFDALQGVLEALGSDPRRFGELRARLAPTTQLSDGDVRYLLDLAIDEGLLEEVSPFTFRRTPLGEACLEAFRSRRQGWHETSHHLLLRARAKVYLEAKGIVLRFLPMQGGGRPTPDGTFEARGVGYNLEVECTNLRTAPQQTVAHLRDAMRAGRRLAYFVGSREEAIKLTELIAKHLPDASVDQEFSVLMADGEPPSFVRFPDASKEGPFLPDLSAAPLPAGRAPPPVVPTRILPSKEDHLWEAVRKLQGELSEEAQDHVSIPQFFQAMSAEGRRAFGEGAGVEASGKMLGHAAGKIGVPSRGGWNPALKKRVREYSIRGLVPPPAASDQRVGGSPVSPE